MVLFLVIFVAAPLTQQATAMGLVAGGALTILGLALRSWSNGYAGTGTRRVDESKPEELVTLGPFKYVRNPIYIGNQIALAGLLLLDGYGWSTMLWVVPTFLFYCLVVTYEEDLLKRQFNQQYDWYMQQTPRWFPRIEGRGAREAEQSEHDAAQTENALYATKFAWHQAWRNERHTAKTLVIAFALRGLLFVIQSYVHK